MTVSSEKDNILFVKARSIGGWVFLGIIFLGIPLYMFAPRSKVVPFEKEGCYYNAHSPDIEIKENRLNLRGQSILNLQLSYTKDNIGDVIYTDKLITLSPSDVKGKYTFVEKNGRGEYFRFIKGENAFEVVASDGATMVYRRDVCRS